ncbi:MAG TPA: CDP-alcohol phosphatidyltransferase family protein [Crocinitomicaceae bacterium]|nr:CDP-alcohol phosphatidyltransferase family protein [Crocinitomicaceae bacterium]
MFNIPNILTALNLVCGLLSIAMSLTGLIEYAIYPIFGSLLFDYLDGFVARLLKQQGELGKQLDSLADIVSFGVAPGMWMLVLLPNFLIYDLRGYSIAEYDYFLGEETRMGFRQWVQEIWQYKTFNYLPFLALLIPVFSMFRLAKFNLDTRQTTSFIGLPTPANTLFFMIFPILFFSNQDTYTAQLFAKFFLNRYVAIGCIVVFSYLLISELPLFSLKFKTFSFAENKVRYLFLSATLIALIALKFLAIPIIIVLYLVFSIIEHNFVKK